MPLSLPDSSHFLASFLLNCDGISTPSPLRTVTFLVILFFTKSLLNFLHYLLLLLFLMFWVLWPGGMWDLTFPTRIEPESPALEGQVLNMGLPGKSLPVILDWYNNGSEKKIGKLNNHALVSSPTLYSRNFYICLGIFVHSPWTLEACSIQLARPRAGPSWFSRSSEAKNFVTCLRGTHLSLYLQWSSKKDRTFPPPLPLPPISLQCFSGSGALALSSVLLLN